ncbi:Influenza virus NS1A-binding protein-like A [Armadillidium vulgare]|nr:Influenza virus NS1A-binding protein-like A [Armadillidium vulgare]
MSFQVSLWKMWNLSALFCDNLLCCPNSKGSLYYYFSLSAHHLSRAENSLVAVVTLNNSVAVLSIQQQLNAPVESNGDSGSSRPPSVEKVDSYTLIPHMRSPKCASGVGTLNGWLIVCGGYDRGECLIGVEAYDPETNTWTQFSDMKETRGRFDLTVLNGMAYAVGGCNGSRELDTVEVLNGDTLEWEWASPLPLARSNTGIVLSDANKKC